jgi:hypothetical protein
MKYPEPYEQLEEEMDSMGEEITNEDLEEGMCDPKVINQILLHGVDRKVEGIKIKLSQKDCEECGHSKIQKENLDFFEGRFLCEDCFMSHQ